MRSRRPRCCEHRGRSSWSGQASAFSLSTMQPITQRDKSVSRGWLGSNGPQDGRRDDKGRHRATPETPRPALMPSLCNSGHIAREIGACPGSDPGRIVLPVSELTPRDPLTELLTLLRQVGAPVPNRPTMGPFGPSVPEA